MNKLIRDALPKTEDDTHLRSFVMTCTTYGFYLLLTLILLSHATAQNPGPFGWLAQPYLQNQFGWQVGPLALLPFLVLVGWLISLPKTTAQDEARWTWGRLEVTLPILAFTLLASSHLLFGAPLTLANLILLFWLIYLFVLNMNEPQTNAPHKDGLKWVFLIVLVGQSMVAIWQFTAQRPLNLTWLGEATMSLDTIGTSVVTHNNSNWLRAYGINSHPNQLGLLLVAMLLMLWPHRHTFARAKWLVWVAFALGLMALLVSWSRSAWLALMVGTAVYLFSWTRSHPQKQPLTPLKIIPVLLITAVMLLFLFNYRDIVLGRLLLLNSPLETHSIVERKRDITIALQLVKDHPLLGVGLGNYQTIATQINPSAQIVHNVPLLIMTELGGLGVLLWLAFLIAPLTLSGTFTQFAPQTAVWLALITISMWQPEPHLFLTKGAVLWGLATAAWSEHPQQNMRLNHG